MKWLHHSRFAFCLFILVFLFNALDENAAAQDAPQTADTARAVELYKKGDKEKAFELFGKILKARPDDAEALYYAGALRWQDGETAFARPFFERLIVLQPQKPDVLAFLAYARWLAGDKPAAAEAALSAIAQGVDIALVRHALAENYLANKNYERALEEAERALENDSKYEFAYIAKHFALLGLNRKADAARNLEQLIQIIGQGSFWDDELEYLRAALNNRPAKIQSKIGASQNEKSNGAVGQGTGNGIGNAANQQSSSSTNAALQILTKPQPRFTEFARKAGVSGAVLLQVTFSADGTVKNIRLSSYLPFGLTEQAIEAARRIKFAPMVKNGVPVSVAKTVEFKFTIY